MSRKTIWTTRKTLFHKICGSADQTEVEQTKHWRHASIRRCIAAPLSCNTIYGSQELLIHLKRAYIVATMRIDLLLHLSRYFWTLQATPDLALVLVDLALSPNEIVTSTLPLSQTTALLYDAEMQFRNAGSLLSTRWYSTLLSSCDPSPWY